MGQSVKVSKKNPAVAALLALAFPGYKGRKVSVEMAEKAYIEPAAEGGTFDKVVAVNMAGEAYKVVIMPFSAEHYKYANEPMPVPEGIALVVHSYYCGKDVGVRIYVAPPSVGKLGPEVVAALPAPMLALPAAEVL